MLRQFTLEDYIKVLYENRDIINQRFRNKFHNIPKEREIKTRERYLEYNNFFDRYYRSGRQLEIERLTNLLNQK